MENSIVKRCREIAIAAHGNQMYGEGEPYSVHLEDVARNVIEMKGSADVVAAAWLHDTLEDTHESPMSLLYSGVPVYVLALVDAVSNPPNMCRAERHAITYQRIARMPDAVLLKQADRIANVSACIRKGDSRLKMYGKEHHEFYNSLGHYGSRDGWEWLNKRLM